MKKISLTFISVLILIYQPLLAQQPLTTKLKSLYDQQKYDELITHAPKAKKYPAKAVYYIGLAYYMKADDANCLKFIDLAISKNPNDHEPHYIKGMTLNYIRQYDKAIKSFKKAISLKPGSGGSYAGLGDAYYNLNNYEKALEAYQTALRQNKPPERAFFMISQIYVAQKKNDKALEALYAAKRKVSKTTDSYITILLNISNLELQKNNSDKAEAALLELMEKAPHDYHTYAKLIQIYFSRKEYEKAKPLKEKLYLAYNDHLLKDNLKDMFCFDQFKWKDRSIQAFERFEDSENKLYTKHLFYIKTADNQTEFRVQTENSPSSNGAKYVLTMVKDGIHSTFNITFNKDFNYDELKQTVINILEGKLESSTSTLPGRRQ